MNTQKIKKQLVSQDTLSQLKYMHKQINTKLNLLGDLNKQFQHHQQLSFLKTFSNVMDVMGQQLMLAQQKYKNIDLELQKDQKCMRFQKQIHFFRQQCILLTNELQKTRLQIEQLKDSNDFLKQQNQALHQTVLKKIQQKNILIKKIKNTNDYNNTSKNGNTPTLYFESNNQSPGQFKKPFINIKKPIAEKDNLKIGDKNDQIIQNFIDYLKSVDSKIGVDILKNFIKNQIWEKKQSKQLRQFSLKYEKRKSSVPLDIFNKNELLQLWQQCVRQSKSKQLVAKFLSRNHRLQILYKFLNTQKFIELMSRQLLGKKCCNNWNCLNNFGQGQNRFQSKIEMSSELRSGTTIYTSRRHKLSNKTNKFVESYLIS